jgi:hypothetical protein
MNAENQTNNRFAAKVVPWNRVHLYKRDGDNFEAVLDIRQKATALLEWLDNRTLPMGFSFIPMQIVNEVKDYGDARVIHAMSLLWYRFDPAAHSFFRILDPVSVYELSFALASRSPVADGCSPLNMVIDYNGIQDRIPKPFNAPRFKLPQK